MLTPTTLAIAPHEEALKAMLNNAFAYLNSIGYTAALVRKYNVQNSVFLPTPIVEQVK
jgi:hypothetical protein